MLVHKTEINWRMLKALSIDEHQTIKSRIKYFKDFFSVVMSEFKRKSKSKPDFLHIRGSGKLLIMTNGQHWRIVY